MMIGKIEEVDGHFVGTKFFAFIGPLFPTESMYVTSESFSRSGNVSTHSWSGVGIPLQPLSVILGYLRVWLPVLACVAPFILMWGERVEFNRPEYLVSVGLIAVWIPLLIFPGRLSKAERAERTSLGEVTGLRLDPKRLDRFQRETRTEDLAEQLSHRGLPTEAEPLAAAIASCDPAQLALAHAYGRYAAVEDKQFGAAVDAARARFRNPNSP